jgi:hypothetical protein
MLSNRTIILGSAAVVVVLAALLALGPRPEPRAPIGTEATQAQLPTDVPRVTTVSDYITALTLTERKCFEDNIGAEQVTALEQGSTTISDAQLDSLNACVNKGLPNPAGVLE